jgi:hypothetical protein
MNAKLPYAIAAAIQERVVSALSTEGSPLLPLITAGGAQALKQQVLEGKKTPENMHLDFSPLLNMPELFDLLAERDPTDLLKRLLNRPRDIIRQLMEADDPKQIGEALREFFAPAHLQALQHTLGLAVEHQFSIALSLITTLKNLVDVQVPKAIEEAYLHYFFADEGFRTVDGIVIVPPAHLSLANLKDLFSDRTAERYVRDLTHLIVEAAGDVRFELRTRYPKLLNALPAGAPQETAGKWFKGFASMAESWVTSAVEEACLGVAEFQTNPLLAAAAGTYAGTAARKAAQHVFLKELEA